MASWLFIYFFIDGYLSYFFWATVENTVGYYILVDFFQEWKEVKPFLLW